MSIWDIKIPHVLSRTNKTIKENEGLLTTKLGETIKETDDAEKLLKEQFKEKDNYIEKLPKTKKDKDGNEIPGIRKSVNFIFEDKYIPEGTEDPKNVKPINNYERYEQMIDGIIENIIDAREEFKETKTASSSIEDSLDKQKKSITQTIATQIASLIPAVPGVPPPAGILNIFSSITNLKLSLANLQLSLDFLKISNARLRRKLKKIGYKPEEIDECVKMEKLINTLDGVITPIASSIDAIPVG